MTSTTDERANAATLADLLKRARSASGLSYGALADATGLPKTHLFRLERGEVKNIQPAHLALLAEPLGLSLYELYAAAGYRTASALPHLGQELEDKLRDVPPAALGQLERYVERLIRERSDESQLGPRYDLEGTADD